MLRTSCKSDSPPSINEACQSKAAVPEAILVDISMNGERLAKGRALCGEALLQIAPSKAPLLEEPGARPNRPATALEVYNSRSSLPLLLASATANETQCNSRRPKPLSRKTLRNLCCVCPNRREDGKFCPTSSVGKPRRPRYKLARANILLAASQELERTFRCGPACFQLHRQSTWRQTGYEAKRAILTRDQMTDRVRAGGATGAGTRAHTLGLVAKGVNCSSCVQPVFVLSVQVVERLGNLHGVHDDLRVLLGPRQGSGCRASRWAVDHDIGHVHAMLGCSSVSTCASVRIMVRG